MHAPQWSVYCIVCTVQCAMNCTLCSDLYTTGEGCKHGLGCCPCLRCWKVYSVQYNVYSVKCTVYSVHKKCSVYTIHCAVTVQNSEVTMHAPSTAVWTVWTVYCSLDSWRGQSTAVWTVGRDSLLQSGQDTFVGAFSLAGW